MTIRRRLRLLRSQTLDRQWIKVPLRPNLLLDFLSYILNIHKSTKALTRPQTAQVVRSVWFKLFTTHSTNDTLSLTPGIAKGKPCEEHWMSKYHLI